VILREGLNNFNDSVELRYLLTYVLEHLGLRAEAEDVYQQIFDLNSDFAPAHHAYANILSNQGRYNEALQHLTRAIEVTSEKETLKLLDI
jgi:tetratricopeptide (TPR) repeat protein